MTGWCSIKYSIALVSKLLVVMKYSIYCKHVKLVGWTCMCIWLMLAFAFDVLGQLDRNLTLSFSYKFSKEEGL